MPRPLRPTVFVTALVVTVSCTDDPIVPNVRAPIARFTLSGEALPPILDVPFPSDVYLSNGKIVDPVPGLSRLLPKRSEFVAHELGKLDGFSRIALAHFYVDDRGTKSEVYEGPKAAEIDPSSLPLGEAACASPESSVLLLDLEAPKESALVPCRAYVHFDTDRSTSRPNVAVGPAHGALLAEGHRYAAVLTNRVKTKEGRALLASPDFERVMKGDRATAILGKYVDSFALVKDRLPTGLLPEAIVAIAPFTTHRAAGELFRLRDALEKQPVPALEFSAEALAPMAAAKFTSVTPLPPGFTATLDDYLGVVAPSAKLPSGVDDSDLNLPVRAHDRILSMGTAAIRATSFLQIPPGSTSNGYDTPDFATFSRDASGDFVPYGKETIWISITLPKSPMPANGYPLVVFAHGLSESRHVLLQIANVYAAAGWATAAIDSITFGARSRNERYRKDVETDYQGAPGAKYKGPDGIADADSKGGHQDSVDLFGSFYNLGAARDQLRQSMVDMADVVRALAAGDLTPLSPSGTSAKIDPTRIAYQGNSLGSVEGTLFAATDPRVRSYVLGVVGGALVTEIGAGSPDLNQLIGGGMALNFDVLGDYFNASNPVVSLLQTAVEPGDPILYAPNLVRAPGKVSGTALLPRNVLATEVLFDGTIPNDANEAFHRAAGLPLAVPNVGSNAEISDIKSPASNPNRVPLTDATLGADGTFHDVPVQGVTALVVQVSPGIHANEFLRSSNTRSCAVPYAQYASGDPFKKFSDDAKFRVRNPYRELQAMAVRFFQDGFDGKVPSVSGLPAPIRDADDDGSTDDVDADSNDPKVK